MCIISDMNNVLKVILICVSCFFVAVILFIVFVNVHMCAYSSEYIAEDIEQLEKMIDKKTDAVIVFGAYVYDNGTPCPMLEDRLLAGSAIWDSGFSSKILLSGDHGTRGYDEVNAMKEFILKKGYEKRDVFLDHAGFSTYDTVVRAKKIFLVESAVLSTQNYHLVRAVYIARKSGIKAFGISADLRQYPEIEIKRYTAREWLARTKDFIYVNLLKPDPVFLGETIPITGDSSPSYDQ